MVAAYSAGSVVDLAERLVVPRAVREIAQRLEDAGYETWAVGGAVRDGLLGRPRGAEWDLATRARPEIVRRMFRRSYPIGIEFGTVGVRGSDDAVYEVTTFRRDIATDGRHAVVEYSDELDEDLARRDFTINAIAYHPLRDEFHDPFDGRADLRRRVLRSVGEPARRFAEDYLRILRGLRFASRYQLEIEPATWRALRDATSGLSRLSAERIREELLKVLGDRTAAAGLEFYWDSGALGVLLPELDDLSAGQRGTLVRTVDAVTAERTALRLAALLSPVTPAVESILRRLKFANAEIREAVELTKGLQLTLPEPGDDGAARRWVHAVGRQHVRDVLRLHFARARGSGASAGKRAALADRARSVLRVTRRGDPVGIGDLAIDGNDLKALGLEPGPRFAEILDDCLAAVMENPSLNRRDRLIERVRERFLDDGVRRRRRGK